MTAKINYVVACYFGPRSFRDPKTQADPLAYVRENVATFERLEHSLAQISFVVNADSPVLAELAWIPNTIRSAAVVVIQRPNHGYSYGGFSHAVSIFGERFTHYLLMEDDSIFTQHRFDEMLLDEMQKHGPRCGVLAGAACKLTESDPFPHGAACAQFCTMEAIRGACARRGGALPYVRGHTEYGQACGTQMDLGYAFGEAGFPVQDWLGSWPSAYREGRGDEYHVKWVGREGGRQFKGDVNKAAMVVPVQALDVESRIYDYDKMYRGRIQRDGTIEGLVQE